MKLRSITLAALAFPVALVAQQTPPAAPPAQSAPATAPAPAVKIVPPASVRPLLPPPGDPYVYLNEIDREAIRRAAEEARIQGQLAAEEGRRFAEFARIDGQRIAEEARLAAEHVRIDAQRIAEEARWAAQEATRNMKFDFGQNGFMFTPSPRVAPAPPSAHFNPLPQESFYIPGMTKQQQWQDPADSAYQFAHQAFSRQDYSRAAARFADFIAKFPNSRNVTPALYYQAFSYFRIGTLQTLRDALKILETNQSRFDYDYSRRSDAPVLQARVLRALADRNEGGVEAKLRDLYAKYPKTSCDQDAVDIKAQVLNSLYQMDPDAAMQGIRQNLATKDACSAELRRTSLMLLANRPTSEKTALIAGVAKNDTVRSVRLRAVEMLSRMPDDAAITALQDLMRDDDEQVQRAAVRALMRSDNPKARSGMIRSLIDNRSGSETQRVEAIGSFDRDNTSPEDAAYLRQLYNRQGESERIKEAVIRALGRMPTEENMKFLLDVAKNANESSYLRSRALSSVTSRQNLSTDDLVKLYDASDARSMRQSLVSALGQRPEQAAVNKLLEIVRFSTDPEVRSHAIRVLLDKKDAAITAKVLELIK